MLISNISCYQFDWSQKIKTPFHERFKCHNQFEWSFITSPSRFLMLANVTILT
jgi:hypothetical protein